MFNNKISVHIQQGASLIVVMLILIVATVLGIGGAQIAMMGEKSSRNDRDQQMAWQGAEAALMSAEIDIRGPNSSGNKRNDAFAASNLMDFPSEGCGSNGRSKGLCMPSEAGLAVWLQNDLGAADGNTTAALMGEFTPDSLATGNTGVRPSRMPRYFIEALPDPEVFGNKSINNPKKKYIYRVTAMGFGPRDDIQAVNQMVFRKE